MLVIGQNCVAENSFRASCRLKSTAALERTWSKELLPFALTCLAGKGRATAAWSTSSRSRQLFTHGLFAVTQVKEPSRMKIRALLARAAISCLESLTNLQLVSL